MGRWQHIEEGGFTVGQALIFFGAGAGAFRLHIFLEPKLSEPKFEPKFLRAKQAFLLLKGYFNFTH